jgi:hypothetical protein
MLYGQWCFQWKTDFFGDAPAGNPLADRDHILQIDYDREISRQDKIHDDRLSPQVFRLPSMGKLQFLCLQLFGISSTGRSNGSATRLGVRKCHLGFAVIANFFYGVYFPSKNPKSFHWLGFQSQNASIFIKISCISYTTRPATERNILDEKFNGKYPKEFKFAVKPYGKILANWAYAFTLLTLNLLAFGKAQIALLHNSYSSESQIYCRTMQFDVREHKTPKSATRGLLRILTRRPILTIDIVFYPNIFCFPNSKMQIGRNRF